VVLFGKSAPGHITVCNIYSTSHIDSGYTEMHIMMLVDPADLLPCHMGILQVDFERLGKGSGINGKLWLTKMHSAIAAADSQPQCIGPNADDTEQSS
jgi:hypothetical protein